MTVHITVPGADDSVDAGSDGTGAVTEDASTSTATGSVSASDVDGDDFLTFANCYNGALRPPACP